MSAVSALIGNWNIFAILTSMSKQKIHAKTKAIMKLIKERPAYLKDEGAVITLSRAAITGNKIFKNLVGEEESRSSAGVGVLIDYAQMLLDFSYAIELKLVNEEFIDDYQDPLIQVFHYLDESLGMLNPLVHARVVPDNYVPPPNPPRGAAASLSAVLNSANLNDESFENTLDAKSSAELAYASNLYRSKIKELLECVYWRKGALCYMYCHTANINKRRLLHTDDLKAEFLYFAGEGVQHLAFDMKLPRKDDMAEDYTSNDEELMELIKQGIFSDVNMLALMYATEMCYWITLVDKTGEFIKTMPFDPRAVGRQVASQYIRIANGPLKGSKWITEQAVEIKAKLKPKKT